jgi:hypothetical protein
LGSVDFGVRITRLPCMPSSFCSPGNNMRKVTTFRTASRNPCDWD